MTFYTPKKICSTADKVLKRMCDGCRSFDLSQRNHTCLLVSKLERIEIYFQDILNTINEDEILNEWTEAVEGLREIHTGLKYLLRLRLGCKDWRETQMKTETWKSRMVKTVKTLVLLERHF